MMDAFMHYGKIMNIHEWNSFLNLELCNLKLTYTIYEKFNHLKTFYECHMN
jgi:hypothetical protein